MAEFTYEDMFPLGEDETEYRLLTGDFVSEATFEGEKVLKVAPEGLTFLAENAFRDVSHLLRPSHLEKLAKILDDPDSSDNDRFVAMEMMKNAVISAEMVFPMCQDTGTGIVMGKKGQRVWTGGGDARALSEGVFNAYTKTNLRYSQNAPLTMYEEKNTACNLPAQVEIYAVDGDAYKFLFIAKGGGSANKTYLFQETKAVLNPETLVDFMTQKMKSLGTAACPPYHLAFVVGGTSAEFNLKTVKLASACYLDGLPTSGSDAGHAFRDLALEEKILEISRSL
ncbi:MAG: fumarate hydratase, partial [Desulfobacterales bacterium]|nr:fumarate hydratase [Desulfobacterales bacterium]